MLVTKIVQAAILITLMGSAVLASDGPDTELQRCSDQDVIYDVEDGDSLYDISKRFGSTLFWESLYVANADIVKNPNLIYPYQKIKVPYNVANYLKKDISLDRVIQNPFCKISELPYEEVEERYLSQYSKPLLEIAAISEREREEEERREQTDSTDNIVGNSSGVELSQTEQDESETIQRETERQIMIEIDGMVHDDTRSKVGRDFYSVFYTYWQSPPDAQNFTISVEEQPSPNLGTTIFVTVNHTETFRMRLQPRYEMIEEAGKHAVRQTYAFLQNNYQETIIY